MTAAILTGLYLGILAFDYRVSMKGAGVWGKVLYLAILTVGFAFALARELGIAIASPTTPIERAVAAIFNVK